MPDAQGKPRQHTNTEDAIRKANEDRVRDALAQAAPIDSQPRHHKLAPLEPSVQDSYRLKDFSDNQIDYLLDALSDRLEPSLPGIIVDRRAKEAKVLSILEQQRQRLDEGLPSDYLEKQQIIERLHRLRTAEAVASGAKRLRIKWEIAFSLAGLTLVMGLGDLMTRFGKTELIPQCSGGSVIQAFALADDYIAADQTATIEILTNEPATWRLSSALGNPVAPSNGTTAGKKPANAEVIGRKLGVDEITLQATSITRSCIDTRKVTLTVGATVSTNPSPPLIKGEVDVKLPITDARNDRGTTAVYCNAANACIFQ